MPKRVTPQSLVDAANRKLREAKELLQKADEELSKLVSEQSSNLSPIEQIRELLQSNDLHYYCDKRKSHYRFKLFGFIKRGVLKKKIESLGGEIEKYCWRGCGYEKVVHVIRVPY